MPVEEWKYTRDNISAERLKYIEDQLGINLPDEFKQISQMNNGGRPVPNTFIKNDNEFIVKSLLRLDEVRGNIIAVKNDLIDRLPEKVFPFANDNFGNYFCFDYRKSSKNPDVVYYEHEEKNLNEALIYLADSFAEFINSLS